VDRLPERSITATAAAKLPLATAGHYNMPSAFPTSIASVPRYRRPLSWGSAAREVTIPQQRRRPCQKRTLAQIVDDPVNDPSHRQLRLPRREGRIPVSTSKGGAGRFTSARTRVGLGSSGGGFYIVNPLTLAPLQSDFWMAYLAP
jgi:hypothetical protein